MGQEAQAANTRCAESRNQQGTGRKSRKTCIYSVLEQHDPYPAGLSHTKVHMSTSLQKDVDAAERDGWITSFPYL